MHICTCISRFATNFMFCFTLRRGVEDISQTHHSCIQESPKLNSQKFKHVYATFTLDGISLHQLYTIFEYTLRYIIHCLTLWQSQIYVSRRHFVNMEPAVHNKSCQEKVTIIQENIYHYNF